MKNNKGFAPVLILLIILIIGSIGGVVYFAEKNNSKIKDTSPTSNVQTEENVIAINQEDTNNQVFLIGGASSSKKDTIQKIPSQQYVGTGLQLGLGSGEDECKFIVNAVVVDSPASLVNIKKDDCFIKIGSKNISDFAYNELDKIAGLLQGESGTKVNIAIFRKSENKNIEVNITRGTVNLAPTTFDHGEVVFLNDVWSSNDMINWKIVSSNGGKWRSAFETDRVKSIYFNNKFFVFANGEYPPNNTNIKPSDVWSSVNGKDWNKILANAPWSKTDDALSFFDVLVFNKKIYVVGTLNDPYGNTNKDLLRDVYSSFDGIKWTKEKRPPWHNGLTPVKSVVFKDKIFTFIPLSSEIWSSSDGSNWQLEKTNFKEEYSYSLNAPVVFKNNIYIFTSSQIVHSTDGLNWKTSKYPEVVSDMKPFMGNAIVLNNKLWIINQLPTLYKEDSVINSNRPSNMWSSDDGINWNKHNLPNLLKERLLYTFMSIQ